MQEKKDIGKDKGKFGTKKNEREKKSTKKMVEKKMIEISTELPRDKTPCTQPRKKGK